MYAILSFLVLSSCPVESQSGTLIPKSDQMVKVNFRTISEHTVPDKKEYRKGSMEELPIPKSVPKKKPAFPNTEDVEHTTDTEGSLKCLRDTGSPPDTNGAVGPDHLFTTLNYRIHAQKKDGTDLGTVYPQMFWKSVLGHRKWVFDPRVVFDPHRKKWVMSYCAMDNKVDGAILVGVSESNDPTGNWFLHRIAIKDADKYWIDFATLGFNEKRVVVAGWLIPKTGVEYRFCYFVFDKNDLYDGNNGRHSQIVVSPKYWGDPAVTIDTELSELIIAQPTKTYSEFCLFQISGTIQNLKLESRVKVSPKWNWTSAQDEVPQKGTKVLLDAFAGGGIPFVRNSHLWMVQSINPTKTAEQRCSVMWWQINLKGEVVQQGFLDDPTGRYSYIYPSIAVNNSNDVLIGYTRSSTGTHPSACFAYRRHDDPSDSLRGDFEYKSGEAPFGISQEPTITRWGDYSASCVDPSTDELWTLQEYAAKPTIGTRSAAVQWKRLKADTIALADDSASTMSVDSFLNNFMPKGPYGSIIHLATSKLGVRSGSLAFVGVTKGATGTYKFELHVEVKDKNGKILAYNMRSVELHSGDRYKLGVHAWDKDPVNGIYYISSELVVTGPDGKTRTLHQRNSSSIRLDSLVLPDNSVSSSPYEQFLKDFIAEGSYGSIVRMSSSQSSLRTGAIAFVGVTNLSTGVHSFELSVEVKDEKGKVILNNKRTVKLMPGNESKLTVWSSNKHPVSGIYYTSSKLVATGPDGKTRTLHQRDSSYTLYSK